MLRRASVGSLAGDQGTGTPASLGWPLFISLPVYTPLIPWQGVRIRDPGNLQREALQGLRLCARGWADARAARVRGACPRGFS